MNRSKKIGILLGILMAVCMTTVLVMGMEQKKEEIRNTDEIILSIPTDTVTALSWDSRNAPQPLSYHKDEGGWLYDGDGAFPVDTAKMEELLAPFRAFGAAFIIEDVTDFSQYGLDDPTGTIRFTADGTDYEIKLGDFSKMDSQRYVSIGDGNVYLVKHDPMDDFDAVLGDTIRNDVIPSFDQIRSITLNGEVIRYQKDSGLSHREKDVYFRGNDPLDPFRVDSWLQHLSNTDLSAYVSYNVTPGELTAFGLDEPELTAAVEYSTENEDGTKTPGSITVTVSRDPAEKLAAESSDDPDEEDEVTAYLRVGESQIIYKINTDEYRSLMAFTYDDLRHEQILPADFDSVAAMEVSIGDASYTLTSEPDQDDVRVWKYNEETVSSGELNRTVSGLKAESFTDDAPTGKEELSFTVTLDDEAASRITVTLYRQDGERCLAAVDGRPVAYIPRSQMVELTEAINSIVLG